MKVAIVTRNYHNRGGIERVSQYLARGLTALGHEVTVVCMSAEKKEADANVRFVIVQAKAPKPFHIVAFARASAMRLRQMPFDAVLVMGVASLYEKSIIIANSVHQFWYRYSLASMSPLTIRWWLKFLNPHHYVVMYLERLQYGKRLFSSLIAASETTKKEMIQEYGLKDEEIVVLPNGADWQALTPRKEEASAVRKKLGVSDRDQLMIFVANEFDRKGLKETLLAMEKINDPHLKLLIVSPLSSQPYLALLDKLDLTRRVIFHPATANFYPLLWAADLFVMPTKYEAWSLAIVEAQGAGLPVITTRLGGADTVVEHEKSGYLLNSAVDVEEIASCIKKWQSLEDKAAMSSAARARAREYDWDKIVKRLDNLLCKERLESWKA